MRFSIIIPAYNSEHHIRKCLDSIEQQVFKDYELIVVCDSCTDRTHEIAEEYSNVVVDDVNFGCDGPTRSRGIDLAKGDYILFLDDDDWWLHEYVLTQLDKKLQAEHEPDVLCFSFIYKHWKYAEPKGLRGGHWIAVWSKCWKRTFVGATRFPNVQFCSDRYFNDAMIAKGGRWVDYDLLVYYYDYKRKGSQTQRAEGDDIPEWIVKDRGY